MVAVADRWSWFPLTDESIDAPRYELRAADSQRRTGHAVAEPVSVFGEPLGGHQRRQCVQDPPPARARPQHNQRRGRRNREACVTRWEAQVLRFEEATPAVAERVELERRQPLADGVDLEWPSPT